MKASDKTTEKNIENSVGVRTQHCFTPFPTTNGSESSPLKLNDTIIPVCKADLNLTKCSCDPIFRRMFHSASLLTVSKAFVKSANCSTDHFMIKATT